MCVYKYTHLYTTHKTYFLLVGFYRGNFFLGGGQYINLTIYKFIMLVRVRSAVMRVPEELSRSGWLVRQGEAQPLDC